ncbi:hypothetical protein GJAV_G00050330 [Gymnothorax javanicus]|nr:hypothetical protein GJAV_G00050330 [Gymnothorax javanicus]
MDISGIPRMPASVLPAAEPLSDRSADKQPEKPRCSSTPCSPIRSATVLGYQILRMDPNYLVGFTTGEELLKRAQHRQPITEKAVVMTAAIPPTPRVLPTLEAGLHRNSRQTSRAKSRLYQPYNISSATGRRRRRIPSSGGGAYPGRAAAPLHGPLPLCLLTGKRPHYPKSLDYLNLDKMASLEPADTETLQRQLQHLTLRGGERMFARNTT